MDFEKAQPIDQITAVFDGTILEAVRKHPLAGNINPYYEDSQLCRRVGYAVVASRIVSTLYSPPESEHYGTHRNGIPFGPYLKRLPNEMIDVIGQDISTKLAYDAKLLVTKPGEDGIDRYELSGGGQKIIEEYGTEKVDNTLAEHSTGCMGCLALAGSVIGGGFWIRHFGVNFDEHWQWARELFHNKPGAQFGELMQGYFLGSLSLAGMVMPVEKAADLRRAKAAYRQYQTYQQQQATD